MVHLFLSEPSLSEDGNHESIKQQISLLHKLESTLWSLISRGSRSEARLWLCNSISSITSITRHQQHELFVKLLKSKPLKRAVAAQVFEMIFEKHPHKAGSILAKKSHLMENFFKGNPRRILQWFSNFSGTGNSGHSKGAKALSQFAFVNRDICWEELEWKGKHGQSPAIVATKPYYFLDLDVQKTVENFIKNVPEFWSSDEFADSLKDGEILLIDKKFFIELFIDLMCKEDAKEAWKVINEFLKEESFSSLCHHLLIFIEEQDFYVFFESLHKFLYPRIGSEDFGNPSHWLEVLLSKSCDYISIDQLLLLNAVISQGRQLMRLVCEEEDEEENEKVKDIVVQILGCSNHPNRLVDIMRGYCKEKILESVKWLGLQSWAILYRLSDGYQTCKSWESLFTENGISFRKSDNYELLHHDGSSVGSVSDLDEIASASVRRKKKQKHRKKRRKNLDDHDLYNDELLVHDMSTGRQYRAGSWLLSTDGFSTSWSSVDLPEHLSQHCLSTWMKQLFLRWRDES